MLKILRIVFGLIGFMLAIYGLIANTSVLMPYVFFFLGAMLLVIGISEFQKKQKRTGFINIFVSGFMFFVSVLGFFFN